MPRTVTSADGTELAVRSTGDGTPIVLVHGANGDIDTFRFLEPPLSERHTVWVYSRRGRGGSGDGADYCLAREIEDVLAVLAAAGEGAHLLGVSGGALFALLAAPQVPSLRSLTLYEPPFNFASEDPDRVEDIALALEADPDRGLEEFFPTAGVPKEEIDILRSLPEVWERVIASARLLPRELRSGVREMGPDFEVPDVPTLYLYGEETDSSLFLPVEDVPTVLPHARLHGLAGQRHMAFAFDPAAFAAAVLAFTSDVESGLELAGQSP